MSKETSKPRPKILLEIHKEIIDGSLHIPVLPAIAMKVRESSKNPDQGIADLAQLIQSDAALTAYLLQVANSSFFSRISKSKTLLQAINRLGLNKTLDIAIVYCVKTLFTSRQTGIKNILRKQWERSTYIAAISSVLASHCKNIDPERALLAGLIQDIGSLPVIEKMGSYLTEIQSDNTIHEILSRYSSTVGVTVLESWGFDKDLIEVVRSREKWQRESSNKADIADVVLVARLHSYIGTTRMKQLPRINEIPAFKRLNLEDCDELGPEMSLAMLEEAKEEIKELHQSLL